MFGVRVALTSAVIGLSLPAMGHPAGSRTLLRPWLARHARDDDVRRQ